jgi:HD-GYP domain-containing protein (c-di-GMP phosphodiesterase class II)
MEHLADALERRDPYTHSHSDRVAMYVAGILTEMPQIPFETAEAIRSAARIHDLGKVGIADRALSKAGPLTIEERKEIEQHPEIGAEIIGQLGGYRQATTMVRHHHERWDGTGYPAGLRGEEIPLGARIIAVADTFDAMTTDRPYRPALSQAFALQEILRQSNAQFDPQVVAAFERYATTQLGIAIDQHPEVATAPSRQAESRQPVTLRAETGATAARPVQPVAARRSS